MDELTGLGPNPFTPFHDLATKHYRDKTLREQFEQMLADKKEELFTEFKAKVAKTYPKLKEGARVSVNMGFGETQIYILARISGNELVWINTQNGKRFSQPFSDKANAFAKFENWTVKLVTTEGTF